MQHYAPSIQLARLLKWLERWRKGVNPGSSPAQATLNFQNMFFFLTKYDITTHPVHITNDMDRVILPSKTHYFPPSI